MDAKGSQANLNQRQMVSGPPLPSTHTQCRWQKCTGNRVCFVTNTTTTLNGHRATYVGNTTPPQPPPRLDTITPPRNPPLTQTPAPRSNNNANNGQNRAKDKQSTGRPSRPGQNKETRALLTGLLHDQLDNTREVLTRLLHLGTTRETRALLAGLLPDYKRE